MTSELTFTPEEEEGSVELSFTFDASALRGKTVVAFESVSYQDKEVAVHADIKSAPQSSYFPEIGTTAKDGKDGDSEAFAGKDTQIVDTVSYKGLVTKDTSYRLVGILMDKETREEVQIDGKPVTDAVTREYMLHVLPQFAVGFIATAVNVMISSYLYSTERSFLALNISVLRSIIVNAAVILILPYIFGESIIWFSLLIYEVIVLIIAAALLKHSERNGIHFKE